MGFIFEPYMETLRTCPLFYRIAEPDLRAALGCLGARSAGYDRGETILAEGGPAKDIGILLSGAAQIVRIIWETEASSPGSNQGSCSANPLPAPGLRRCRWV